MSSKRTKRVAQPVHTKDADCTVGPDDFCTGCKVHHGPPCVECGGRGYHVQGCAEVEAATARAEAAMAKFMPRGCGRIEYWPRAPFRDHASDRDLASLLASADGVR